MKLLKVGLTFLLTTNLAFAQNWFRTGQNADLMLSGVDFNNTGGPLLFNHPSGIASDGTRLLLCDRFNNRVLIWNALPTKWDALPDLVLGQENFVTNNTGASKSGLSFPGNVSASANGVVTIADTENDRILIWKQFPTQNAQPADIAISLPAISLTPAKPYGWPWGVWTDGTRLAVVATNGGALLFWKTLPTRDDQTPDYTVSLTQFGTPRNISTDGATYFFVGDHNAKIGTEPSGTFFWNSFPTQTDQPYDFFRTGWIKGMKLPDGKLIAGGITSILLWNTVPNSATQQPDLTFSNSYYANGDGPDVVLAGGRLYVNNYNGNNVQVYQTIPTQTTQMPDFALGSPAASTNTLNTINYIQNPVPATDGNVLLVTSDFDATLSIWKTLPVKSGLAPDVKINLRNFNLAPWDNALHNGRFVVAGKHEVAVWNALPRNGEAPSYILTNRIGSMPLQNIRGVALDENYFYLADENGTLGIWRGLPTTSQDEPFVKLTIGNTPLNHLDSDGTYLCVVAQSAQPAIYIYRVADIAHGSTVQPFKTIDRFAHLPLNQSASAITFNGSFAIANRGGHSVLLWKDLAEAGDPNKAIVLGQSSLNTTEPGIAANRLFMPSAIAAHGNFLWVGEGKFSSRLLRFSYGTTTGVVSEQLAVSRYQLAQNYPNPFNPNTTIRFSLPQRELVTLRVFDALGKEIGTLVNGALEAGEHQVVFDATGLPSGVYFYQIKTPAFAQTRKAVLLR